MFDKSVAIVIPCYWANDDLIKMSQECFKSCRATTPEHTNIIVVNDGSPLEAETSEYVINKKENGGYAKAVNTGLTQARENDFIVISNNDIVFIQPDWLNHLLKPLQEGYGISSIRTTEPDGWQTEDKYEENKKFGSIWAITKQTLERLGYLDESFGKGYYEDQDYWRRARDAGIKIVKNNNGLVEHKGKATFKLVDNKDYHLLHAMFKYKEKWGDRVTIREVNPTTLVSIDDYDEDEPGFAYAKNMPILTMDDIKVKWPQYL